MRNHQRSPLVQQSTSNGRQATDHGRGRTCNEPGCKTVLSRYNASTLCAAHVGDWTLPSRVVRASRASRT
jgi:hypothetical protein